MQVEAFLARDGEALHEGSDYVVDVNPRGELLTIRPVSGTFSDGCYRISVQQTQFGVVIKSTLPEVHKFRMQSDSDDRAPLKCRSIQQASVLVPKGSVWKYLDDGTDQGTAWREPEFDDSRWKSGPAQLGYGETDQATTSNMVRMNRTSIARPIFGMISTSSIRRPSVLSNCAC